MGKRIWKLFETVLEFVLLKILHLSFLKNRWDDFLQFVKFGMVGLSNTLISYGIYLFGVWAGWHYLAASVVGFVVSVINAFYWNNRYVFAAGEGEKRNLWKSFCKTFMAYAGTGLVLNNILLVIQIDLFHWPKAIAPLINLLITIPLNFILNKLWAFRGED